MLLLPKQTLSLEAMHLLCIELYPLTLKSVVRETSSHVPLLLEKNRFSRSLHRSEVVLVGADCGELQATGEVLIAEKNANYFIE